MGRWSAGAPPRLAVLTLALTATAALVGGCASNRPPAPASATDLALARTVLIQDAPALRSSWQRGLAEVELRSACMRDHGYTYAVAGQGTEPSTRTVTADALGTGTPATYGFGPATTAEPHNPGDTRPRYVAALDGPATPTETMALPDGTHVNFQTGGCVGAARVRLFGSVRAFMAASMLPQNVHNEFGNWLARGSDTAYTAATRSWQSCMTSRGWTFTSPDAAIDSVRSTTLGAAALDQRQTAIAAADTTCDHTSNLRATRVDALDRYLKTLPSPLVTQLANVYTSQQHAAREAGRVLAS